MMPGMIMLWYGTIATVPSGWAICDGNNNTPDLRQKFVIGPISDAHPFYKPNAVGGSTAHVHDFTGDGHAHDLDTGQDIEDVNPLGNYLHSSVVTPATGTTDTKSHYPDFVCLCYIMKLPIP